MYQTGATRTGFHEPTALIVAIGQAKRNANIRGCVVKYRRARALAVYPPRR
jgi:hypothetical protein